ncbi:DNA-3-methyladenine glycosylase family protein [uncultured Amnibacterium sp.]|uniref:DNA-3-methyladenine glycosylase family protein n=1 Tax=uncultured Amnibacterium sp. TaxID=1631851 RepID=UPI0035CC8D51
MTATTVDMEVRGPWSLATGRAFWEGFAPAALPAARGDDLTTVLLVEADWSRAEASVAQDGGTAAITVDGDGDLDAAAAQVARFLALDVDATFWPAVGERDPVIAEVQAGLPGLRPCGFHSPYEAAAWAVLSQRIRIPQAATLRSQLTDRHGDRGAFPAPAVLRGLELDLPGRKAEYLRAVADAALDGLLDGLALRSVPPEEAIRLVQQVKGIGPFAAELVVVRGANAPDAVPHHERRLDDEITARYGDGATVDSVSAAWRPFRTWAAVHLRAAREGRLHEFG